MRQAPDFREAITRRMAANEPCWFPGLAEALVTNFWATARSFHAADYSTAAWLGSRNGGPALPVSGQNGMALEPLPLVFKHRFNAPAFEDVATNAAAEIAKALARLDASGAADAVMRLVRSVHCIAPRGRGYDCSHSEPTIPFSVFVSVPIGERQGELRLAESLLHEAMHLQLTLIEQHAPIIESEAGVAYSPWQQCPRPAQGVLHGLYVFTAIAQWLNVLGATPNLPDEDQRYVDQRRAEIREEVAVVAELPSSSGLTPFGRELSAWLLEAHRAPCKPADQAIFLEDNCVRPQAQLDTRKNLMD